jgi:multidrug resistance efflux pump
LIIPDIYKYASRIHAQAEAAAAVAAQLQEAHQAQQQQQQQQQQQEEEAGRDNEEVVALREALAEKDEALVGVQVCVLRGVVMCVCIYRGFYV